MEISSIKLIRELKKRHPFFELLLSRSTVSQPGRDYKEASRRIWNGGLFFESYVQSLINKQLFSKIEAFCIFIGYSRSGHSIIGSLLDAHPNVIISHEINALYFKGKGFGRDQIFSLILNNSRRFARAGRGWSGNSYQVDGQWQGNFTKLKIIGDKMGGWTSHLLRNNVNLLGEFREHVGIPIKCVHHVRNPFDCISRMALVLKKKKITRRDIDYYFSLASANHSVKNRMARKFYFEEKHENFIVNPKSYLIKLCRFLNVPCKSEYLKACAAIVNKTPSRPRFKIYWDKKLIKYTSMQMSKYDFLKNYKY
jgi:hypothetical protein